MASGGSGIPVTPLKVNVLSQGRLTLQSGVPVPITDQVGKSVVYFTPYLGNTIALWGGARWLLIPFSEISITLSGLTSGKNYDVFAYFDPATAAPVLELSAAWSTDTNRTDALALQNGIRVKAADHTRRYLGTIRATGATTTEDSLSSRLVMNWYNRIKRDLIIVPGYVNDNAITTYATSSTTWVTASVAIGGSLSTLQFLSNGEDSISCRANASAMNTLTSSPVGIGIDSATVASIMAYGGASGGQNTAVSCEIAGPLSEGKHSFDLLVGAFTGTTTYAADVGRTLGGTFDTPATELVAEVMA